MKTSPANIQEQLGRIRRLVIWSAASTLGILAALLAFLPLDERVLAHGTIRPGDESRLHAPRHGILDNLSAKEGDFVSEGSEILRMETGELQERLHRLDAEIQKARSQLENRQSLLAAREHLPLPAELRDAAEESALSNEQVRHAQITLDRASELYSKGVSSKREVEKAELELQVAKTRRNIALKRLGVVKQGLGESILGGSRAEVLSASSECVALEVEREGCLEDIKNSVLKAPRSGRITRLAKRHPGEEILRGEMLVRIVHGDSLQAELLCGENQFHRVRPGQRVLMRSHAFDHMRSGYVEGVVRSVSLEPEEGQNPPAYKVQVDIEKSPEPLVVGSSVDARILLRRAPLWRILLSR